LGAFPEIILRDWKKRQKFSVGVESVLGVKPVSETEAAEDAYRSCAGRLQTVCRAEEQGLLVKVVPVGWAQLPTVVGE